MCMNPDPLHNAWIPAMLESGDVLIVVMRCTRYASITDSSKARTRSMCPPSEEDHYTGVTTSYYDSTVVSTWGVAAEIQVPMPK